MHFFREPYHLANAFSILTYIYVRQKYLDLSRLITIDAFGISREVTVCLLFAAIILLKRKQYFSEMSFFVSLFYYGKILVLVLTGISGNYWAVGFYLLMFAFLWLAFEIPKYKGPSKIVELTGKQFSALFDPATRVQSPKSERYIFCVFYAEFSFNCVLVG